MDKQLTEEQAWDEYIELTKLHNKVITLKVKIDQQLDDWIDEEVERYEKAIAPLMPYVKDKILEQLELGKCKHGEELREMGQDDSRDIE